MLSRSDPYRDQNYWFENAKPKYIAVLACRNNVVLLDRRLISSGGLVYEGGPYKWAVYDCSDTNAFGDWLGFKTRKAAIVYFVRLSGTKPAFTVNDKIEGTVAEAEVKRVLALTSEGWKKEPSGAEIRGCPLDSIMPNNKFGSDVEVCCHTVNFRYWDFDHEVTEKLEGVLAEHAEERAKQCIIDGCSSGDLNCYYHIDDDDGEEIRGWWEIAR